MSGYIWYSSGSDVTGTALANKLGFQHGKKTPQLDKLRYLIGWGCSAELRKLYDPAALRHAIEKGSLRVLNHPKNVGRIKNKLSMFHDLKEKNIPVPGFISLEKIPVAEVPLFFEAELAAGRIQTPCVGFSATNKGKPVFFWTAEDLRATYEDQNFSKKHVNGIAYLRSLFNGKEYRIHVFRNEALCAQVKVLNKDPFQATADSLFSKIKKTLKGQINIEKPEVKMIVENLASDLVQGPSHLQRSLEYGWAMEDVSLQDVPNEIVSRAINALDAVDLDLGAVNIIEEGNSAVVTNIISAPSLDDNKISLYQGAIKEFLDGDKIENKDLGAEKNTEATSNEKDTFAESRPSKELLAKITNKIILGEISQEKAEKVLEILK